VAQVRVVTCVRAVSEVKAQVTVVSDVKAWVIYVRLVS